MANKKKLKVAITGSIGSGKTTFSNFLKEKGYPVIFADRVSKEILSNDPLVKKTIVENFGRQAYIGSEINKVFLAENIFSNPEKLKKINSILHPLVRDKIEVKSKKYLAKKDFVFIEAALIYESKIEKMYDFVVLITADEQLRQKRSLSSKKLSKEDFNKRNDAQLDEEKKIKKADFVFNNNGTKKELEQKALLLISILNSYLKQKD